MHLPWLREPWRQLIGEAQQHRLSHAHCIPAREELGASVFTENFVRFLLCQNPTQQACGQCKSCLLWAAETHPDYYELKSDDGRAIGVDKVRELTHQLQQTASQQGAKVAWIKEAHRLTTESANALLKTLEEPSPNTYLILSPERTADLLPTLRSRMQLHRFVEPDQAALEHWLTQQLKRSLTSAERHLVTSYQGAPLTALAALRGEQDEVERVALIARAAVGAAVWPQPTKDDANHWLMASIAWLQELLRVQQQLPPHRCHYPQLQEWALTWLQQQPSHPVTTLSHRLSLCYNLRHMTREQSGLNLPLLLQNLWLQWQSHR